MVHDFIIKLIQHNTVRAGAFVKDKICWALHLPTFYRNTPLWASGGVTEWPGVPWGSPSRQCPPRGHTTWRGFCRRFPAENLAVWLWWNTWLENKLIHQSQILSCKFLSIQNSCSQKTTQLHQILQSNLDNPNPTSQESCQSNTSKNINYKR